MKQSRKYVIDGWAHSWYVIIFEMLWLILLEKYEKLFLFDFAFPGYIDNVTKPIIYSYSTHYIEVSPQGCQGSINYHLQ